MKPAHHVENSESNFPFFIVGSPRSGTTLLQTLIDAHPAIAIPPESHVFDHFYDLRKTYGDVSKQESSYLLAGELLRDERIKRWGLQVTPEDFCMGLQAPVTFGKILERLFQLYAQKEGKHRWGDKTPEHTLYLNEILETFPEARFIHLVRDGRDVAESLSRMFFGPITIDKKAQLWHRYTESFYQFKKKLLSEQFIEIHYEQLVRNPENEMKRILEFLGETETAGGKQVPNTRLKEVYLSTDDGSHQSLNQPISDKKIGSFKGRMSRRQIEIFESIAGDMLSAYGYTLESTGNQGLRPHELILFGIVHQFRFFTKWGHWEYLRDRIQFYSRKFLRSVRGMTK